MEKKYYKVYIKYIQPADKKWNEPEHPVGRCIYAEASSEEEAIENVTRWAKKIYLREFKAYKAELVTGFVPDKKFLVNG